jgi:hypothetical protein
VLARCARSFRRSKKMHAAACDQISPGSPAQSNRQPTRHNDHSSNPHRAE